MKVSAITKKRMKGALIISLLLVSAFAFFPTLFIQQAFANTTVFTVNNEIWINATGISPSGDGEPTFLELKLEVSQSADNDGNIHTTANEGDRTFSPSARQEWVMFKDMTRSTSTNPTDYYEMAPNAGRYFGYLYANNTMNLSSIPGSYFESKLPATGAGSSVREVMLQFDAPATYAEAYCAANGYTYLNVINASYEPVINYNALNTYRSKFLESVMYTLEDTSLTGSASALDGNMQEASFLLGLLIGACIMIVGAWIYETFFEPDDQPELLDSPNELDPPDATPIENITITAMELFTRFSEQALAALINGSIDLATYLAIVNLHGNYLFGAANTSLIHIDDLWRDYYNTSESMYDTYADKYDNYLQAFSASWTDWLTTILIMIVVIIILIIIYKVVSRKTADSAANAPQFIMAH